MAKKLANFYVEEDEWLEFEALANNNGSTAAAYLRDLVKKCVSKGRKDMGVDKIPLIEKQKSRLVRQGKITEKKTTKKNQKK